MILLRIGTRKLTVFSVRRAFTTHFPRGIIIPCGSGSNYGCQGWLKVCAAQNAWEDTLLRIILSLTLAVLYAMLYMPTITFAEAGSGTSIITATGQDVPSDGHLDEDYRFPSKYRDNAVQFRTEDGVLLCGYVIGKGSRGITLGHPNG